MKYKHLIRRKIYEDVFINDISTDVCGVFVNTKF